MTELSNNIVGDPADADQLVVQEAAYEGDAGDVPEPDQSEVRKWSPPDVGLRKINHAPLTVAGLNEVFKTGGVK